METLNTGLRAYMLTGDMVKSKQDKFAQVPPEGVDIECKRCGYKWKYRGKRNFYIQCAQCHTSINIQPILVALAQPK